MKNSTLSLQNIGQIKDATLAFRDLTVLVGPQATGKSITLQILKLMMDCVNITSEMRRGGLDWDNRVEKFLDVYLGEGMRSVWNSQSRIEWEGKAVNMEKTIRCGTPSAERLFYIPAQRTLTFNNDSWLRSFDLYRSGDPYVVRAFSERIRVWMDSKSAGKTVFPQPRYYKTELQNLFSQNIFAGFKLEISKPNVQKRLVLQQGDKAGEELPYMVWSAGQREFVPLLLGTYRLLWGHLDPSNKVGWVVIEEPETGLHPKAVSVTMLMVFELLLRGYRVCLSTHSSQILDMMWALKHLRENNANPRAVLQMFPVKETPGMVELAEAVLKKTQAVYYFDRSQGTTRDISDLDPSAEEDGRAGFGGLSEFNARACDAVAAAVANPRK